MKQPNRSPSYLIRNAHSYCFRMIVPKDLQKFVGKTELRYSLKTGFVGEAKHKARLVAGQVQLVFRYLRAGGSILSKLSDEQIQQFVKQYIKDSLKAWDRSFYSDYENNVFWDQEGFYNYVDGLDNIRKELVANLNLGDCSMLDNIVDEVLEKNGITEIDKNSLEYLKLCTEIHKAEIRLIPLQQRHMLADFSYKNELPELFPDIYEKPQEHTVPTDHSIAQGRIKKDTELLSVVIQHFVAENKKGNWSEKTKQENESSLNLFLEAIGDVPIGTISRRQISDFKATLQKLPPNKNKVKKYRDKSINELVAMDIGKTLSVRTINKTLTRITTLFNHALKNGFIEGQNPATDMNMSLDKSEDESRAPFTKAELKKLMRSDEFINDTHSKSYQFWMPVIAIYTGMRQNEIAQLHLDDIRKNEEGVWLFDVNDRGEKKVKNKSSRRLIPMHNLLTAELRLPEYVKALKAKGEKRLFPELRKGRDGYARSVSQWFNIRYKVKCGIKEDDDGRMKDFHSFRTTVNNHLAHKKVSLFMLKQVMGHSKGKDVGQLFYTEKYSPKELLDDVISKINYGVDLSHLKKSRFVPK